MKKFILFIIATICSVMTATATVKADTCLCNNEVIAGIYTQTTTKGNVKYFIKYVDADQGISALIPTSESVVQYTYQCKQVKLHADLGIVWTRSGNIRIIKYRKYLKNPKHLIDDLLNFK